MLEVVLLALHAGDHIADAAPIIEAFVQELKLRLARLETKEAERGAENEGAGVHSGRQTYYGTCRHM